MAQYKSFAPKGSFSDFQIAVPDQTKQIEKEAARQMRGKEAAQNFKEKNERIYIDALKLKFSKEEQQRDENFNAKIQNLKANQDFNREKFAQQIEAEKSIAQQKAKGLKDLANLSKTALSTYAQIDESFKKSERAALHQIALESGLNFEDLQSIRGIQSKLTKAQFNQIEFIQRKITEGATPAQINALYRAYEKSGSSQWVNVTSVYQQSALSHSAYMDQELKDWFKTFEGQPQQPTIEQINAKVASINAGFIESKFTGARREVLESSGVYNQIRTNTRTLLKGFHETNSKEIVQRLKDERFKGFTNTYKTAGGMAAIVGLITSARSRQSRDELFEWMETGLATGALKVDDVHNAINQRFDQDQSLAERFPNSEGIARVMKAVRQQGTILRQNYAISEDLRKTEVHAEVTDFLNKTGTAKGYLDDADLKQAEERLTEGGGDLAILDPFLRQGKNVLVSEQYDEEWTLRKERTGIVPTQEEIDNAQLIPAVHRKWTQLRAIRNKDEPLLKAFNKKIVDILSDKTAAPPLNKNSFTIDLKAAEYYTKFRKLYDQLGYDQATAAIIGEIRNDLKDSSTFDKNGHYASVMKTLSTNEAQAKAQMKTLNNTLGVILQSPTGNRDYKELATALTPSVVYNNIDNVIKGKATSPMFNYVARTLRMNPTTLAIQLHKAVNSNQDISAIASTNEQILKRATSEGWVNVYNTYLDKLKRLRRLNATVNGTANDSFSGNQDELTRLVSSGEGGTNSVNRGRSGDTPRGAQSIFGKNLDEMTFAEVNQAQNARRVFAVGAYQFTPGVLDRARRDAGLPENAVMTLENQTKAFWGLVVGDLSKPTSQAKRPRLAAYLRGESDDLEAALVELSLEWASIQGPGGTGQYDNDSAGNFAHTSADGARKALKYARRVKPWTIR